MPLDLIRGASYPFRALRMLTQHPHLLQYLAIPFGVNIIIGGLLYFFSLRWAWRTATQGYFWINNTLDQLVLKLPTWLQWLDYGANVVGAIAGVILVLLIFIGVGLILVQFGVILGAPWYGKLSEKLEQLRTNQLEIIEVGIFRDIGRAILFELKKLALIITISPLLFIINFLPGFGSLISTIGGFTLTVTIICLDFFDATLERRRLPFRRKIKLVYQALPASAGFGFVCLGLISVPLLNLITIPICVASGTLFVCDRLLPKLKNTTALAATEP